MAKLVVMITAQLDEGHRIAERWYEVGAPGVTLIESYGLQRFREAKRHGEILPGTLSMLEIFQQKNETSLIALSVVENDELVEKLLAETRKVSGDLLSPNTGIVFVMEVEQVIGVRRF